MLTVAGTGSVIRPGIYRCTCGMGCEFAPRSEVAVVRQHLRGAIVAGGEVRGGPPETLSQDQRVPKGTERLLYRVLQCPDA